MDLVWSDLEDPPRLSARAWRMITAALVLNMLAIAALLIVIVPAGNKAVLYKVQNWPSPWCRPFGCDRG
jgi:hypothetical protein